MFVVVITMPVSHVAIAIISRDRIAWLSLWEFFFSCLFIACSLVTNGYTGVHGPLSVATSVDRSDRLHMDRGVLQR